MLGDKDLSRAALLIGSSAGERKRIASKANEALEGGLNLVAPSPVPMRWRDAIDEHGAEWCCVTFLQNLRVALIVPGYIPVSVFDAVDMIEETALAGILPDRAEYGMVVSVDELPGEPEEGVVYIGGDHMALAEILKSFGGM